MAKNAVTDWDENPNLNTDIGGTNIDEGCAPSGMNNAVRAVMSQVRSFFRSDLFRLRDGTDQTKLLAFDLSGQTTALTRTQKTPNYNGTLSSQALGAAIASATTTNIGAATGSTVHVTGTTTITGLGTADAGIEKTVVFDGALTLTYNATSLILLGGSTILTSAGDTGTFVSEGAGNWRCTRYQRASTAYDGVFSQAVGSVVALVRASAATSARLYFRNAGMTNDGDTQLNAVNNELAINNNGAENSRFLQAGGLAVGATSTPSASVPGAFIGSPDISASRSATAVSTARNHMTFINPNGTVGSISTATTVTTYATSSDQRLKEHFEDFDSGKIIDAIKVYEYQWKVDGSTGYGPKAQELYGVFPLAVAPGNDAKPTDDDFMPWGWDAAKLVPVLIRELQSVRARLAELEGK